MKELTVTKTHQMIKDLGMMLAPSAFLVSTLVLPFKTQKKKPYNVQNLTDRPCSFCLQEPNRRALISCSLQPPLQPANTSRSAPVISYAQVLEQCATSLETLVKSSSPSTKGSRKYTIDFPPERSETRAGTLVSRFENNLNFINALLSRLGCDEPTELGPRVEIRDNVNPQGGGEYITDDECMIGLRARSPVLNGMSISLLLNAGVDASTLKQIRQYDDEENKNSAIVLVNCGLERVSWFAKIGFAKYLDAFDTAYYLKDIAPAGWLLKMGEHPWTAFVNSESGCVSVEEFEKRPPLFNVESKIRLIVSQR